jgi:acetyl-CoA carboxylase biotin carboxylase subunit
VEHPVTEVTTGIDLVEEQLRIAAGMGMSLRDAPARQNHVFECRIYAEDPRTFLPSPGRITELRVGDHGNRRHDLGYEAGDEVPMFYDSLIGKVIAWGDDRAGAHEEIAQALDDLTIEGPKTNIPALTDVLRDERFTSGRYHTGLLGK